MLRRSVRVALALVALVASACARPATEPIAKPAPPREVTYTPTSGIAGATHIAFKIPRTGGMSPFDAPWPTDLARDAKGRLDLDGFPAARSFLVAPYVREATRELDGWSLAPVVYFRFEGEMPLSLPETKPDATSPVLLVDVDPASPKRGEIVPIELHRYLDDGAFVTKGLLAVRPVGGFVLRESTTYAAIVRRSFGDASGAPLGTTDDAEAIKWTKPRPDPIEESARVLHGPAFATLGGLGIARADVAAIAVFRTQSATRVLSHAEDAIRELDADHAPRIVDAHWEEALRGIDYETIVGHYCTPNFQERIDEAPFLRGDGGAVREGEGGKPRVVDVPASSPLRTRACGPDLLVRFVLSVPRAPAPEGGYPLAVTAHGTGGDATTFLGDRDFASFAAKEGVAMVSTDQPLHGAPGDPGRRPGAGVPLAIEVGGVSVPIGGVNGDMLFYNPLSPAAARGNMRQATLDVFALIRLFDGLDLATTPLDRGAPRPPPRLRSGAVFAVGHSQGSQSVAIAGALSSKIGGVGLSGCGGDIRNGVLKNKEFAPVRDFLVPLLGLSPHELDTFHPLLSLVQMLADATDPESYASLYLAPRATTPNVIHLEGMHDNFVPEASSEALAAALHATPLTPLLHDFPAARLLRLTPRDTVHGNAADGKATIAFAQIAPTHREDGHFVVYYEEPGERLFRELFRTGKTGAAATFGP